MMGLAENGMLVLVENGTLKGIGSHCTADLARVGTWHRFPHTDRDGHVRDRMDDGFFFPVTAGGTYCI
jgi:hypothetical protein